MEQESISGIPDAPTEPPVYLHLLENKIIISFKPSTFIKAKLKQIPGAKLNNNLMRYEAPLASYDVISNVFDNLVISESVMKRIKEEADSKRRVEDLKKAEWFEIEDYIPKLPLFAHQKKAFELHRLLAGSGNTSEVGSGKCIVGNALQLVNGQLFEAQEIWNKYSNNPYQDEDGCWWASPKEELIVYSLNEKSNKIENRKVNKLFKQKINEVIRKITLTDGSCLTMTKAHKLFKIDHWSDNLNVGDLVCVPRFLPHEKGQIDLEVAEVLAWLLSEGCNSTITSNSHDFTQDDDIIRSHVKSLLERVAFKNKIELNVREESFKNKTKKLKFCNKEFRKFLESFGYEWGKKSAGKKIPYKIMTAEKEAVRVFLRAMFDAEGSAIRKYRTLEISSASEILIKQLNILLRRFGIWLRTRKKRSRATNGKNIWRNYWVGTIGSYSVRTFLKEIGFSYTYKQNILKEICEEKINTNVEVLPTNKIINEIKIYTKIPGRHVTGGNTRASRIDSGGQTLTRDTLPPIITNIENLINDNKKNSILYKAIIGGGTGSNSGLKYLEKYENLDKLFLLDKKEQLQKLADREVHYVEIKNIEEFHYDGWVYDLEIEDTHNYIAENIITHNTPSAICAIHWRLLVGDINRCLVICPLSLVRNWQEEISRFSDLTYVSLVAPGKEQRLKRLEQDKNVYLINLDYVDTLKDDLLKKGFDMVVVDEAHRIKNPQALQSKATYELGDKAKYRIAMTGSPVLNSIMDCFGFLRFVNCSILGESFYSFRNKYFINLSKDGSPFPMYVPKKGAEKEISDKMYSCSIRFLKSECLDLPETITTTRVMTLSSEQDKAYRQMQEDLMVELGNLEVVKVSHVLTMLMKLNQITSGWLKSKEGEIIFFESNPKFEELKTIIEELQGKPAIIWAYYKADIALINNYYTHCRKCKESIRLIPGNNCLKCGTEVKYRVSVVQGSTKNRNAEIAWFKYTPIERALMRKTMVEAGVSAKDIRDNLGDLLSDGTEPLQTNLFIGQIAAASEGLTLNQALYSIYFSRDYSLKNHIQSMGRNHRAGQKEKVTYINLVCSRKDGEDTVDMRILNKLQKKEDLAQRVNKDDLKLLFGDFKKKDREAIKDIENIEISQEDSTSQVENVLTLENSEILIPPTNEVDTEILDQLISEPKNSQLFENLENTQKEI